MTSSKSSFEPLKLGVAAFVMLIFATVFAALLVDGIVRGGNHPPVAAAEQNTTPVGRIYIRPAQ
jgi:hypothetical protein